ncbi:hypothetical protein [Deinococcus apachensis]|uniref:hypothetical protein n=1 Tax=Deinococcus apachensis TaxID=309886 RepID=UPI00035D5DCE|nr:hypothetical protein [Deinococcus apachensis]
MTKRLLLPTAALAAAATLAACAPTATTAMIADPVFAQGQVWVMTPKVADAGAPRTMTVGVRDFKVRNAASYDPTFIRLNDRAMADLFFYDPADSDPEFIFAMRLTSTGSGDYEACLVREPGAVPVGKLLTRAYAKNLGDRKVFDLFDDYIDTGKMDGLASCTLTRTK